MPKEQDGYTRDPLLRTFGAVLRAHREAAGLSRPQLAQALGCQASWIENWRPRRSHRPSRRPTTWTCSSRPRRARSGTCGERSNGKASTWPPRPASQGTRNSKPSAAQCVPSSPRPCPVYSRRLVTRAP
ncbi:helix-turn-helix transcriptional regulator [Spirillospora sp. NPDC048819]|uniref:helix-turn-helix domain-containing protein n=1 Tax=Spirillospora sp. NPDC048819 TaxID=3155268 RepID=UPI0033F5575D